MVNKPKAIGTAGESGVVRAARLLGFPGADRQPLRGNQDTGDAALVPGLTAGVIVSVKAGAMAKNASVADVYGWWAATVEMRERAGAAVGLLVVARRGYAPARAEAWRCFFDTSELIDGARPMVVEASLSVVLLALRAAGYGDPLDDEANATEVAA